MARKLRMGLIGGGPGSFIGGIHRLAAELDGEAELVCGAFSSSPERSREAGERYRLPPSRVYASYAEMIRAEAALDAGTRMDFVAVVTPNHLHCAPACLALQGGFDVVVDKPMCVSLAEARQMQDAVVRSGRVLAVTYTYSGYPLVKQARAMIAAGRIGAVRKIFVEYPQGWLATAIEGEANKQAGWRTDPAKSGPGGALGDIGTHAAHLAEYVGGLQIAGISAALQTFVPGRRLDDDSAMLLRFHNGASGVLFATQVAAGEENNIRIRVYGERGGIEWQQAEPNSLLLRRLDAPMQVWRAGGGYLDSSVAVHARTPAGHPEGYIEAFANIYRAFYAALHARSADPHADLRAHDFPTVDDGARGVAFVEAVIRSAQSKQKWTPFA